MMHEQLPRARPIRGRIRSRLLVNALVDPDEAARHLPVGVRPHLTDGATVVGCCLLDIVALHPHQLPAMLGARLRAAAHRISVEWDDELGATTVGVYVPTRHTNSRLAMVTGGRWFPGVHRRAAVEMIERGEDIEWTVEPAERADAFGLRVRVSMSSAPPSTPFEPVSQTCLGAAIGLSPDRHGVLEAARMEPAHRRARLVDVDHLESRFLTGFTSALPAPSYLMHDVDVVWTPAAAPRVAREGLLA